MTQTKQERPPRVNPLRSMSQFRRLFAFVRPYRRRLAVMLVAVVLGSILSLAGPYALQFLIDAVFSRNDAALLNRITLILIGIFALQSVVYFVRGYLLATIGERVLADMRVTLFEHLQRLRPIARTTVRSRRTVPIRYTPSLFYWARHTESAA